MTLDTSFIREVPHITKRYPARSKILNAGEFAKHLFIIKSGAARMWFNKDGKDCTLQFFLEGEPICLYESLLRDESSEFTLETIEPTEVLVFCKEDILEYIASNPMFKDEIMQSIIGKMVNYVHLFLSMQIHTPEQRYAELVKNRPDIIHRIPQRYIASFLGITSVSLSRIRSRKQIL
ncbi:MAG: Crp/Fnr family transcriptional regulator [Alistipes sp.]|nr:Crp/Fnr family transcriptional regulator [Alistipes sp.]